MPGLLGKIGGGVTDFSKGITDFAQSPEGQIALGLLSAGGGQFVGPGQPTGPGSQIGPAIQNVLNQQSKRGLFDAQALSALSSATRTKAVDSPFGKINTSDFTPESLSKFQRTGDFADLVIRDDASSDPFAVSEFKFYQSLSPKDKEAFLRVKRAQPGLKDVPSLGVGKTDPVSGEFEVIAPEADVSAAEANRAGEAAFARTTATSEAERIASLPQRLASAKIGRDEAARVVTQINQATDLVGPGTTGFGAILSVIPKTDAFRLKKLREVILANITVDRLKQLRSTSVDGSSGLGQLNKFEFEALQTGIANLDQAQNAGDLKRALGVVLKNYESIMQSYDEQIFNVENELNPGGTQLAPGVTVISTERQ
jgi:hypothetical protein